MMMIVMMIVMIVNSTDTTTTIQSDTTSTNPSSSSSSSSDTTTTPIPPTTSSSSSSQVNATDSDYFLLYTKKSSLPIDGIGLGVYAKDTIYNNNIICEYRGPIISEVDKKKFPYNDKFFTVEVDDKGYSILGEGICSYINDCSNSLQLLLSNDTLVYESNDPSKCYDNYNYNARAIGLGYKVFIIASRDIQPNEEIFFSYSWNYWRHQSVIRKKFNVTNTSPPYTSHKLK
jgi:hypothetical protein